MTMVLDSGVAAALGVAALAGTAVGIERERSGHAEGPSARFAGVRTFFLIGILGGLAGWLLRSDLTAASVVILASAALLIIAAYVMVARRGGDAVDGTTEMAALVVLTLGVVSGLGFPLVTSAITSVMLLALAEKTRIHAAIQRIGELELASALRFAVLALVVLPVLPAGPYGPFDTFRPRSLWTVVLLFSALNFVAFLASRSLGARRGVGVSGLLGGLISSTLVTLHFSQRSRRDHHLGSALAFGVIGACTVLVLRVCTLTAVLNQAMLRWVVAYLTPVLLMGVFASVILYYRQQGASVPTGQHDIDNPLGLRSALVMAAGFQVALFAIAWMQARVGTPGIIASAAVLGLTDMDALTYAMNRLGDSPEALATGARGIAIGMTANSLLKLAIALVVGRGEYRRAAVLGILTLAAAILAGVWLNW